MTAALDVLDTKAVAALLRVTAEHVCKLVRRGKLRGFKPGKTTLFLAGDVLAYIRGEHGEDEASGSGEPRGRPALHCLRHAWSNAMRQVAPEHVRQRILGHAGAESGEAYHAAEAAETRRAQTRTLRLVRGGR